MKKLIKTILREEVNSIKIFEDINDSMDLDSIIQKLNKIPISRFPKQLTPRSYKDDGGYVVYEKGDYRIMVNDPNDATVVTLFHNEGKWIKVGVLRAAISERRHREAGDVDFEKYIKISEIEIDEKHRNKGFGELMYKILIEYSGFNRKGILSYLPDRVNKKQIPKIWKSLGGKVFAGSEDYEFIDFKRREQLAKEYVRAKSSGDNPELVDFVERLIDEK